MTDQHSKQARIDALKQDIANLKADHITDEQLARMTEIINIASVQNHQHAGTGNLAENYFQTENLIKTLESDIASLQQSDLLINNELRLIEMQKQLKSAYEKLEELAGFIQGNTEALSHFKNINGVNHLPITTRLYEQAHALNL